MPCRLVEALDEQQLCTYARINTLDLTLSPELSEYWQDPSSYFLAAGDSLLLLLMLWSAPLLPGSRPGPFVLTSCFDSAGPCHLHC